MAAKVKYLRGMSRSDSGIAASDLRIHKYVMQNTVMLKEFRANFNPIGINKFLIIESCAGRKLKQKRRIEGKVIFRSKHIVVLKMEKYTEAFTMASFFIKDIVMY